MARTTESLEFDGTDGASLAARLELPGETPRAFALFAHCFTCSKDVFAASRISTGLAECGIATLRFDFTGLGASGGDFSHTDFSSNVDDLERAAGVLRDRYEAPSLLVGHSLGGAAVIAAGARIPETRAIATINSPADPAHVRHLLEPSIAEIESRGEAEVNLAGRRFRIRKQFLEDIEEQRLTDTLQKLEPALLIFHSPTDELVDIDNARRIYTAARHPKSFLALDGADHLLTDPADATFVAEVLSAWSRRYVTNAETESR